MTTATSTAIDELFAPEVCERLPLLIRLGEVDDGGVAEVEAATKFKGEGTITRPGAGYDND